MLSHAQRLWGILGRKELISVFVMIFIADVVVGVFSPTFSLYATNLGASLTFVGLLSSAAGLVRIVSSIPVGLLSDARGRKGVLMGGMLLLAVTSYLYTVVSNPTALLLIRPFHGLVITSTFFIGMAYAGDVVKRENRGLVSGVYTTCMGLGFTIGSALGGGTAAAMGYQATFRLAAALALAGFGIAWWGLRPMAKRQANGVAGLSPFSKLGLLARQPQLLAASIGYMLIILTFDAAIVNFFPLYADALFISQATIGTMLAVRAFASTSVRLPTGLLTARFSSRRLMVTALVIAMLMVVSLAWITDPILLTLMLAGEGIGFGMFLTSGQAFITENFAESDRGTAMGVYSMTGSISATAGPFILGAVADFWGLQAVFWVTGAAVLAGIVVFLYASSRQGPAQLYDIDGEVSALGSQGSPSRTTSSSVTAKIEDKDRWTTKES